MTPEQASSKYHWVKYDSATNTIEMYLDNYMLSSSRLCESKFYLEHMLNIGPRYATSMEVLVDGVTTTVLRRKPWFFDFGEYVHKCLEVFYTYWKFHKVPPEINEWIKICKEYWLKMDMDGYGKEGNYPADLNKYEDIGGWEGVAGLLVQYYAFYMDLKVRVIDTEITFGHNKEVLLGEFRLERFERETYNEKFGTIHKEVVPIQVICYLTGRIDLLVDNGYKIGPVDHKNTHKFDGKEHADFNPHDGMTGYILAVNEILERYRESGLTNLPRSSGGWIYHIQGTSPSQPRDKTKRKGPRFKATPIDKTAEQLEDYKARQLSTFKRIAELLFNDKTPEWNTISCNNIFNRPCEFKAIHEQPSSEWPQIIGNHYVQKVWDTRDHSTERKTE